MRRAIGKLLGAIGATRTHTQTNTHIDTYIDTYINKIKITDLIHLDGVSFLRIYRKVLVLCDSVNFRFLAMFFMLFFLFFFLMEVMIPVVGRRGTWKYGGNKTVYHTPKFHEIY